jgi:hypothetical protein
MSRVGVYYTALSGVAGVAFLAFIFLMGGSRPAPTGPAICLALAILAIGVVADLLYRAARALIRPEELEVYEGQAVGRRRKELEREYQALKRALKEIEMDHAMGKLSEADYGEIRARYRERAVRVLRQLDQAPGQAPAVDIRRQIELDLAAHLQGKDKGAGQKEEAPLQVSASCPKCSTRNDHDANFCKKCGTRLSPA